MKIQIEVHVDDKDLDYIFFQWLEELSDKCREQGTVEKFYLKEMPTEFDFTKVY